MVLERWSCRSCTRTKVCRISTVTEFGDSRSVPIDMEGHNKATEYVADHLLQLLGVEGLERSNRGDVYGVDFKGKLPGSSEVVGIDNEIRFDDGRFGRHVPVQVFTNVRPARESDVPMSKQVTDIISKELEEHPNLVDAIRYQQGKELEPVHYQNGHDTSEGKLLKKDIQHVLMPGYSQERAVKNRDAKDKITMAPTSLHLVDMAKASQAINSMRASEIDRRLQSRSNWGDSGDGRMRQRIYINADPQDVAIDLGGL